MRCLGDENFIAQIAFAKTSGYATNFLTGKVINHLGDQVMKVFRVP